MNIKPTLISPALVNRYSDVVMARMSIFVGLAVIFIFLTGCVGVPGAKPGPDYYSAEPIEAWVVDAETNQPIAGVNVVAQWILRGGMHYNQIGLLKIMEDVTDENGRFYFQAWGPIKRPYDGYLGNADPLIILYKDGYRVRYASNHLREGIDLEQTRTSRWNGKRIELQRFSGSLRDYSNKFGLLSGVMIFVTSEKNCHWKEIPNMLIALDTLRKHFLNNNIGSDLRDIKDIQSYERECGSPKQFFENYSK